MSEVVIYNCYSKLINICHRYVCKYLIVMHIDVFIYSIISDNTGNDYNLKIEDVPIIIGIDQFCQFQAVP